MGGLCQQQSHGALLCHSCAIIVIIWIMSACHYEKYSHSFHFIALSFLLPPEGPHIDDWWPSWEGFINRRYLLTFITTGVGGCVDITGQEQGQCRTWSMSYVNYGLVSFKKSFRIHKSYLLCDLILCTLVNYYYNHPHLPHHQVLLAPVKPTNQYCRTGFHKFTSFMPIFNYIAPSQWIAVIHNKRTLSLARTPTLRMRIIRWQWWTRAG